MPDVLVCQIEWIGSTAVVHLRGALRVDTTPVLRAAVYKCLAAEPRVVIADIDGVDHLDDLAATAFPALARAAAAWPGIDVIVVAPDPAVRDRLSALGLSRYVPVTADLNHAFERAIAVRRPAMAERTLPAGPDSVTEARALVRDLCTERGLGAVSDVAELITAELVANAVVHAVPPYVFTVRERGPYLHLSMRDATAAMPARGGAGPLSGTGGRGLLLVGALATAWGVTPTDDGKIVWTTLSLRPGTPSGTSGRHRRRSRSVVPEQTRPQLGEGPRK